MKKINSENLWKFVNDLATNEKVKFKVFYDDMYVTEIFWNGEYFEWEEGTFTSEGFFNPLYDFVEIIEDNDKLEKIKWDEKESRAGILRTAQEIEVLARRTETLKKKIAELVDHVNKIEENKDER